MVRELPSRGARGPSGRFILIAVLLVILFGGRSLAQLVLEFEWWKELGQIPTWQGIIAYSFLPVAIAAVLAFIVLWVVHARALKFAGTSLRENPQYARLATAALAVLALIIARSALDSWTIVSFYGSQRAGLPADAWRDPIFNNSLPFYLFELPFYTQMLGLLIAVAVVAAIVFYVAARGWQLTQQFPNFRSGQVTLQPMDLLLSGGLESKLLRGLVALVLVALAVRAWLGRFDFLDNEHGFMVGVDYLNRWINIPLQWMLVGAFLTAAVLVIFGRFRLAVLPLALIVIRAVVPPLVSAAYVKPNEISLQVPYITNHINATRAAYGLEGKLKEVPFPAKLEAPLEPVKNQAMLDNVRLWDWRAFHDTVTQLQALRQYYVFKDTDVDRYMIDGKLRQVMLTPRELDVGQLAEARGNWINAHFIYTHGYGLVMAEANRITPNGQPVFLVKDAPPTIDTKSLQLTRPELYYGEVTHEPVFVRTQQAEFNYPSGSGNVQTKYEGTGGIPINNFGMRLAAAVAQADRNVLLTGYLTEEARMLIRRNVRHRVSTLASFLEWDPDPYLVVTEAGRLVWVIDGYTTSAAHPYSRRIGIEGIGQVNYIRNAVKATVDAYDGTVKMYVFDPQDPIVRAFRAMFPTLFTDASQMPADILVHTRYPELLFRAQAEIYRTFHMRDPESFYNREDLWDLGKNLYGQSGEAESVPPAFVVATLPGETQPEFLLMQPFTPRSKDNLIGVMAARSDGEHLGELVVLQLSKQSLIYGPLQVESRIGSDSEIAKDLSLWNQQGSQVLRGQMLVLPINDTFLYVEAIYIQSAQAKLPQLKKVVLAMGNTLIYRDTYEQALAALAATSAGAPLTQPVQPSSLETLTTGVPPVAPPSGPALDQVRGHMRRYRELSSQGKWGDAGRELEAVERLVNSR